MNPMTSITEYIQQQTEPKRSDLQRLHELMNELLPEGRRWFLDGKNSEGKIVSNPNIGYGSFTMHYADGSSKEFYQIGLSANTTGISVFIMGLPDKQYLVKNFAGDLGKASVSGYCIKFKSLAHIQLDVLKEAIRYGLSVSGGTTT